MKRNDSRLLAGLILFVIGAAGFAYGLITWNNERATAAVSERRGFQSAIVSPRPEGRRASGRAPKLAF